MSRARDKRPGRPVGAPRPGKTASAQALVLEAARLLENGRPAQAAGLLGRLPASVRLQPGALRLSALARSGQGDPQGALALLAQALAAAPDFAEAWQDQGTILAGLGRTGEAMASFRRAADLAPDCVEARHGLGLTLLETGRPDEAARALRQALALVPDEPLLCLHLAWAEKDRGEVAEAARLAERALRLAPDFAEARLELAELLVSLGQAGRAEALLAEEAESLAQEPRVLLARGLAAAALGKRSEAEAFFRDCLERDPADALGAGARLALLGAAPAPPRASAARVRELYEGKARLWDAAAKGEQGYRGHELLAAALDLAFATHPKAGVGRGAWDVLDAGCGTGLCAPCLRLLARRLVGADLAAAMLELARDKGLYDELVQADLLELLERSPDAFDLAAAGAALIYFGDLAPVFAAARTALRPGGLLAFTFFPQEAPGYAVTEAAYYRHNPDEVIALAKACGFTVLAQLAGIHETQEDRPVQGLALVLEASRSPA